jgi:hypothetical protein
LLLEDAVLFPKILDDLQLVPIHPTCQSHQQDLPRNDVDHAPSLPASDRRVGYGDLGGISG